MGNMPAHTDPGVAVSRTSTWSVTSADYGAPFTDYRETITENGVTKVRYHKSRDAYQGSGSGRNLHPDYRGAGPPVFGSGPERGRGVRGGDGHLGTGQEGRPLPEVRRHGQQGGAPPWQEDGGREPPRGGGGPGAKGTPPSAAFLGDTGNRAGGGDPRPLPQPSSRRQGDPPPPHPPPPPYTPHAHPQNGSDAPFPRSDGADPRGSPQRRPLPNPLLSGSDPAASIHRDTLDRGTLDRGTLDRGSIPSGSRLGTDPMVPFSGGGSWDRGVAGRPLGPRAVAQMKRDTSYRTRKAETAHLMILSDVEAEKKRMDIAKDILNDLARR